MISNISFKGTFVAGSPHDWNKEKELQDEMQNIVEWTAVNASNQQEFNNVVAREIKMLNSRHQNVNRRYEVYYVDKGAQINVAEYYHQPNQYNDSIHIPTTIGEYFILRPS